MRSVGDSGSATEMDDEMALVDNATEELVASTDADDGVACAAAAAHVLPLLGWKDFPVCNMYPVPDTHYQFQSTRASLAEKRKRVWWWWCLGGGGGGGGVGWRIALEEGGAWLFALISSGALSGTDWSQLIRVIFVNLVITVNARTTTV